MVFGEQEDLACALCSNILSPPILLLYCDHHVCRSCLEEFLESNSNEPKCPRCQESIIVSADEIDSLPRIRLLENHVITALQKVKDEQVVNSEEENVELDSTGNTSTSSSSSDLADYLESVTIEPDGTDEIQSKLARVREAVDLAKRAIEEVEKFADGMEASLKTSFETTEKVFQEA
ncbi:unnamed protein product [Clavelina lepadiformis]|uniref:RING-type domain-containing protein n=1 Tax=Clavelina lepadiformis TaxID=159417 RepID=A0ABP0GHI8_CLALP